MARTLPVIGLSMGDPSGVGPEVLQAALEQPSIRRRCIPMVFGDAPTLAALRGDFEFVGSGVTERPRKPTVCAVSSLDAPSRRPGKPSRAGARAQYDYVRALVDAAKGGLVDAMCTAPVSKEQIMRAGIAFVGHTELLANAFGCRVMMLMNGPKLRVALATNHLPIAKVPSALSKRELVEQLVFLSRELTKMLGRSPHIAVCGLNPHAGEGGKLGHEELKEIAPAIREARRRRVNCEGPFGADGLFASYPSAGYDVALAMFHDQGLIAAKSVDFEQTVNVTLGLPVPRTSPDHGVAYSLSRKKMASPVPMIAAVEQAIELAVKSKQRRG
jgi:4-hydroxythreonine-4-phosphate dehydrogenase